MATPRSNPSGSKRKNSSTWRSVRMPHHGAVARTLQQRYSLRWHGLLIGSFTLLLMWATSHLQMVLGVDSLALRYLITLSVGYIGYLLVLRAWAARLVRRDAPSGDGSLDVADISWPSGNGPSGGGQVPLPRTGGGDFGGGGASGDFAGGWTQGLSSGAPAVIRACWATLPGARPMRWAAPTRARWWSCPWWPSFSLARR